MVSVIIPVFNSERILARSRLLFRELAGKADVIFVDGGSTDRTCSIADSCGRLFIHRTGLAERLNHGALRARDEILLFVHVNSAVPAPSVEAVERALRGNTTVGGCLTLTVEGSGLLWRAVEGWLNLRARAAGIFHPGQGVFVRREVFRKIGGFPAGTDKHLRIFSRRLNESGPTIVLGARVIAATTHRERSNPRDRLAALLQPRLLEQLLFPETGPQAPSPDAGHPGRVRTSAWSSALPAERIRFSTRRMPVSLSKEHRFAGAGSRR